MKKILITGSTGFIGTELVSFLKKRALYKVYELDRNKYPLDSMKKLQEIIDGKDVIVHLAAKTRGDLNDLLQVNLIGTSNLLEAISKIKGKKPVFIFPSTIGVYKAGVSLTEKSELNPTGPYSLSKSLAEKIVENYSHNFDIPSVIFRIANVYGPTMPPRSHSVVANFIDSINKSEPVVIDGKGSQKRDFVYIDDLVNAFYKTFNLNRIKNNLLIINISSARAISIKQLAKIVYQRADKKTKFIFNDSADYKNYSWVTKDYKKAYKVLNWKPKISVEKGISTIYEKAT